MTDDNMTLETPLLDLEPQDWLAAVEEIAGEDGYVEDLGDNHHAILIEEGTTLLVSFETVQGIQVLSEMGQPLGWDMLRANGWSSLTLVSNADTWFRDEAVYGFIDRLSDDGFFDDFDQVLFYGAGPCGYAAAAFSVAAPGARVVAIQPQATLSARITEWDPRFVDMRRHDFTSRYGYAPEMLDAADAAYVLYDPRQTLDAMHAALFTRPNVTKLRMPFMGEALQTDLLEMETWVPLLTAAADGTLDTARFAQLARARRSYRPYLRNLLDAVEVEDREWLIEALCANVVSRIKGRRFASRLRELRQDQEDRAAPE